MKGLTAIAFFLFLAGVLLFLGQMWSNILSADAFAKISITDGALFLIVVVLNLIIKENRQTDKINAGKSLD